MKKIKDGKKLWSETPSGGEVIYGKEVNKKIKDKYSRENLNENKNV
jgi:hypothetical protein